MDDVLIATSVAPGDWTRQQSALSSWRAAGVELHTLNAESEMSAIGPRVAELGITPVAVDVSDYRRKPLPLIDDFLRHFRGSCRPARYYGIINSDVGLIDPSRLKAVVEHAEASLIFGRRKDVTTDASQGTAFEHGYDFFFLASDALSVIPVSRFRIGVPWWDYWLPMAMLLEGKLIAQIAPPLVSHTAHPVAWDHYAFYDMGVHYFDFLVQASRSAADGEYVHRLFSDMAERIGDRSHDMWEDVEQFAARTGWALDEELRFNVGAFQRFRSAVGASIRTLRFGPQVRDASAMRIPICDLAGASVRLIDSVSLKMPVVSGGADSRTSQQSSKIAGRAT